MSSTLDPLSLVQIAGGSPTIKTARKALVSIRDRIERNGTIEGKGLLERSPGRRSAGRRTPRAISSPRCWLRARSSSRSGREVTVNGQQAIDALKTNNSFRAVGVSLRQDRPSMDVLARAAERLTDLSGDQVVPLEDEIGKAAQKLLPDSAASACLIGREAQRLKLPGAETVESVNQQIADLMLSDAQTRRSGSARSSHRSMTG